MTDPPLSSERAARRPAILDAAVRTFAERGFFASRTREIARRAGVAEGTIYLYFESKDDLLLTAFREKVREFVDGARSVLLSSHPFRERLARFVELQFRGIEENPALATVLLLEARQSTRFYGEPVREVLRQYALAIDELLSSGIERGDLRADLDVPLARRMLVGVLEEIELDWLLGDQSRPLSPLAHDVADFFCRGAGAH